MRVCLLFFLILEHIPVLVACETYKFHMDIRLDAICFNELDDPDKLLTYGPSVTKPKSGDLKLLNIAYDLTPLQFVTVVITEVGLIPPTSVPVVLREALQKMQNT